MHAARSRPKSVVERAEEAEGLVGRFPPDRSISADRVVRETQRSARNKRSRSKFRFKRPYYFRNFRQS
jgi:hypothetical protein